MTHAGPCAIWWTMARSEDEREIRLRPAKPRVTRNEGAAWSSGFKLLMHYARTSRAWGNRAQGGKGSRARITSVAR